MKQKEILENIRNNFSSHILDDLSKEITNTGFAGSTEIPELVYLTLMTGMLERPVSLVIKGSSGAGKSFSLNTAKQFIPETAYEQFEGMSEKALVYLNDLNLKHKHLVIGEAAGMAEGNGRALLRQLLSEGKVKYATVQSTEKSGLVGSTLPTLEGPCGCIFTTTATGLHAEDESRMLSVNIVDSPEQIRLALIAQATGASRAHTKPDLVQWHRLYELIQRGPRKVQIPFATHLVEYLPASHDRIKRDFPHVLSLIQAHALMHAFDREWVNDETVVANMDDYSNVYRLVNKSLSEGLETTVSDEQRKLVETVSKLQKSSRSGYGVSHTRIAEELQRDQSVISRNVQKALDAGYLTNRNPGQGRVAQIEIGERKLPQKHVLPKPEVLFGPQTEPKAANDNAVAIEATQRAPW